MEWGRILPCSETRVFHVGDRVAVSEYGGTPLRPYTLPVMRYYVAHVRETNVWQVGWKHSTCYLRLDEGAARGHEVIREATAVQEIAPAEGKAWEADLTPMDFGFFWKAYLSIEYTLSGSRPS